MGYENRRKQSLNYSLGIITPLVRHLSNGIIVLQDSNVKMEIRCISKSSCLSKPPFQKEILFFCNVKEVFVFLYLDKNLEIEKTKEFLMLIGIEFEA